MVILSPVGDTGLLACSECKYSVLPSRISTHFQGTPHQLPPSERRKLAEDIFDISDIFRDSEDLEKLRIPSSFPYFFPELLLFQDGLACQECPYTIRTESAIIRHYKEVHSWKNPRRKGGKQRKIDDFPWKSNISCQRFFPAGPKSAYFRVNSRKILKDYARLEEEEVLDSRPLSLEELEDLEENQTRNLSIRTQGIYIYMIL